MNRFRFSCPELYGRLSINERHAFSGGYFIIQARSPPRSPGRRTHRGRSRGNMLIWARLSIWNTPIVSARRIMAYTSSSPSGMLASVSFRPVMPPHQVEALADRREHPQGQAIDLEDAQLVQVVLVPLDDGPVGHGRVFDGHQLAQRPAGHHHAAGVLREVPRKADQLLDQLDQLPARRRLGIDARLAAPLRPGRARSWKCSSRLASASTLSSGSPRALPTSRTAERGR